MSEGLHFAALATLVGKKHGARWGIRRVTIGSIGSRDGKRFVMGTFSDGTVVLGEPKDFTFPRRTRRRAKSSRPCEARTLLKTIERQATVPKARLDK